MLDSFEQALGKVQAFAASLSAVAQHEIVALDQSAGRVLARAVVADRDQPPFDRSTRDGFAVRSADFAGAASVELQCLGELPAGALFSQPVGPGQCVEIMTGAPLPTGADAVVMVERSQRLSQAPLNDRVLLMASPQPGENVVAQGAEARAGDEILEAGRRIDAATAGLLAAVGQVWPQVHVQPRVAILTTGNEVVPAANKPTPQQIRNANEYALRAAVMALGARVVALGPIEDKPSVLRHALEQAVSTDLVLITGGVSKGKADHVKQVLTSMGAETVLSGVAMRPGRPVMLAKLQHGRGVVPILALPGNPLSALVTFSFFGRPLVSALAGQPPSLGRFMQLPLATPLAQKPLNMTAFLPAKLIGHGAQTSVQPLSSQGSGDLVTMADADVLICLPPQVAELPAGQMVYVCDKP